jgi:hypothetical protein
MIRTIIFACCSVWYWHGANAQCNVLSKVYPDGSLLYYMEPVKFYWTESKALYGNVVTDKEHYFLAIQPIPFPDKSEGKKIKDDLVLTLANDQVIRLSHYDTQYIQNDSIMEILYLFKKSDVDAACRAEAESVQINMGKKEGVRTYVFKLHRAAFREQLACFQSEQQGKKE